MTAVSTYRVASIGVLVMGRGLQMPQTASWLFMHDGTKSPTVGRGMSTAAGSREVHRLDAVFPSRQL